MKAIKVYDQIQSRTLFVNGVFQVSPEEATHIIYKEGYGSNNDNKSVYYHPKTQKLYIFHHSDVWGRGLGEEVFQSLSDQEIVRIETYAKNRKKILGILKTIPGEMVGENYVRLKESISNIRFEYNSEKRNEFIKSQFPQIQIMTNMGASVKVGERDISIE